MKKQTLLMFLFALLFASNIQAQSGAASKTSQPERLGDFLASLNESTARGGDSPRTHLENLVRDRQPSVYVTAGQVKVNDNNPVALYTDVSSLSGLASGAYDRSQIEIVTIRIQSAAELSSGIDLSALSNFTNLKYVYILSDANFSLQTLAQSITNSNSGFRVLYDIVKPS